MSVFVNENKVGAAAGVAAVAELKNNPELVNQIVTAAVTALVEALVKNIPAIIAAIHAGVEQNKPKSA